MAPLTAPQAEARKQRDQRGGTMMTRVYRWSVATALGMLLAGAVVLLANQQGYYPENNGESTEWQLSLNS